MTEITLSVPDSLTVLPAQEQEQLLLAGLHEAVRSRVRQLRQELSQAQTHVDRFFQKYDTDFQKLETECLAKIDALEAHDDYVDWFYWQGVLDEKHLLLDRMVSARAVV